MKLSSDEVEELSVTVNIINQVENTHRHLGGRVAFLKLVDLSNIGCVEVGVVGCGKSAALHGVMSLQHRDIFTKKFTLAASRRFSKVFSNTEVSWICLEMSDMSNMVMENMLKVVGDLIYDHTCEINTSSYVCNIKNSNISWLAACTYEIFNRMWSLVTWRGTTKDRVLRYFPFVVGLKRDEINLDPPDPSLNLGYLEANNGKATLDLNNGYLSQIIDMLESQFSSQRAYDYSLRLLSASAKLNKRDYVTDADAKFILLHKANILAEKWASSKETVSSPLVVDTDTMQIFAETLKSNGLSMKKFAKKETLKGGIKTIMQSIYRHPRLLRLHGDYVFANPSLVADSIVPQLRFEDYCKDVF
jgi:hypothetical protein